MKRRVLFIDRDGTLIVEPVPDEQVDSLEKLEFLPGVFTALNQIVKLDHFDLVIVTNQDGLGTDSFPDESFGPPHEKMIQAFKNEGIVFKDIFIDRSFEHENLESRKPGTGMLKKYLAGDYDIKGSYVIGDRISDIQLAVNLGCSGILLSPKSLPQLKDRSDLSTALQLHTNRWSEIAKLLLEENQPPRRSRVSRDTNETRITIELDLDGTGTSSISTGLGFLDHMLEQISKHGLIDLNVITKGDLHIDEHHTIEDTALALGEAFDLALGNRAGIERYGFMLPMDDCLAQVAIDFGGRSWLEWDADFHREKIGEMPTEMFPHFFKSFSDKAHCNLNIKAEGQNEHHKIEAVFKAFARAVKMAVRTDPDSNSSIPSTKGSLDQ